MFDNRCFGASDGEPRQEIDPWAQVRDYRHAITYLHTVPEVDPERIGVWGSSYSGGHVLVVAAIDRRVKAVVSQVPLISGHANIRALVRPDFIAGLREKFDADRQARFGASRPPWYRWWRRTRWRPRRCRQRTRGNGSPRPGNPSVGLAQRGDVAQLEMFTEYEPGSYMPK